MSFRAVQQADPGMPALIFVFAGAHIDAALRAALPGWGIVVESAAPLVLLPSDYERARTMAGAQGSPVVLGGYSAGCQSVRSLLVAGVDPDGVVVIDGTHASVPPQPWQIDVWRRRAEAARVGRGLFIATCCVQRYTERIAQGQPGRATATSRVLSLACGIPELATVPAVAPEAYPGTPVVERHESGLHVLAYPSTDCDREAHTAQLRDVLPDALARYAAPIGRPKATSTSQSGLVLSWRDPQRTLGERAVTWSLAQLDLPDARESPAGSNGGVYVAELLRPCVRRGQTLGLRAGNYCAAGACAAGTAALLPGESLPHLYRAAVREMIADAQERGAYVTAAALRAGWRLEIGDLLCWDRSEPGRPDTAWWAHVGRVERPEWPAATIEANTGSDRAWARMTRPLSDPRLLGAIVYPRSTMAPEAPPPPSDEERETARRLVELSRAVWRGEYGAEAIEAALRRRG